MNYVGRLGEKVKDFWQGMTKGFFGPPDSFLDADSVDRFFSDEDNYRDLLDDDVRRNWRNHTPVNANPTTTIRANRANLDYEERVDWAREGF